ncbi:MAG: hypothetical protein ABIE92_13770 [bacterium]
MTPLNEDQIRIVAQIAREELGAEATLEKLRESVRQAVDKLERLGPVDFKAEPKGRLLAICLSLDGLKNSRVLSEALKDSGCKISERFERKMKVFHLLAAVIDYTACREDFETLRRKLGEAGNAAGVRIILQTEDALQAGPNDQ